MFKTALICHPGSGFDAELTAQVSFAPDTDKFLHLRYELNADVSCLNIPATQTPSVVDELWKHTCFECFIAVTGAVGYHEFNFSPSGHWAAYAFSDYRQAIPRKFIGKPDIHCSVNFNQLILEANIAATDLPKNLNQQSLQLGLTAVLEETNNNLSYWALKHTSSAADFHQRDSFIGQLTP